jgi:GNAT superfamily N-acetyltransferase
MNVRAATREDVGNIVELLKISLGESLMPKTKEYWLWKHEYNPFGASPVLVAEDAGALIGVRAFMRWEWTDGKNVYKAIRAVDTATHPEHQGKGIFKKLTLQLLEQCKQNGVHFVFNTPNTQSRPGYLKMGWRDAGRLPVRIWFNNPLLALFGGYSGALQPANELFSKINIEALISSHKHRNKNRLQTNYNAAYLQWRYSSVPVAQYYALSSEMGTGNNELLICRLKKAKFGTELRVTDYFGNAPSVSQPMLTLLKAAAVEARAMYATFSGVNEEMRTGIKINRGPIVTVRDLQFESFSELSGFKYWQPSFGDLELF